MTAEPQRTDDAARTHWHEPPTTFLLQPRAHSALKHELEAIATELTPLIDGARLARPDGTFELIVLPHRVVVRVDDAAVSFSWVGGRLPTVADGCLLVIAWANVATGTRGVAALKSGTPTHERTYVAAAASPVDWRWCAIDRTDQPLSTRELTAEWFPCGAIAPEV